MNITFTPSKWSCSKIYIWLKFSEYDPPQHPNGLLIVFFSSKYLPFFSQAITHTMLNVIGPLPLWLALLWSNVLHWTMYFRCLCLCFQAMSCILENLYFSEGVLVSLSIGRICLLVKVKTVATVPMKVWNERKSFCLQLLDFSLD